MHLVTVMYSISPCFFIKIFKLDEFWSFLTNLTCTLTLRLSPLSSVPLFFFSSVFPFLCSSLSLFSFFLCSFVPLFQCSYFFYVPLFLVGSVYPRIFAIVVSIAIFHVCAADLTVCLFTLLPSPTLIRGKHRLSCFAHSQVARMTFILDTYGS